MNKFTQRIIALLITATVMNSFYSCKQDNATTPNPTPAPNYDTVVQSKKMNVSYGPNERNVMDIFLPAKRTPNTPFILLIHGGGWIGGSKTDFNNVQDSLLTRGIASASMSYRYASTTVHYEQLMEDVDNALELIKSHTKDWIIRDDKYVIGGYSAGAHMSLLYGFRYDPDNDIAAIISNAGPSDITDTDWLNYAALLGQLTAINNMVGAEYVIFQPLPERFSLASPIKGIKNVPTLMIHGDVDNVVNYNHSTKLHAQMQSLGYTSRLVTLPGVNHDMGVSNPATVQLILTEMTNWINTYGKD